MTETERFVHGTLSSPACFSFFTCERFRSVQCLTQHCTRKQKRTKIINLIFIYSYTMTKKNAHSRIEHSIYFCKNNAVHCEMTTLGLLNARHPHSMWGMRSYWKLLLISALKDCHFLLSAHYLNKCTLISLHNLLWINCQKPCGGTGGKAPKLGHISGWVIAQLQDFCSDNCIKILWPSYILELTHISETTMTSSYAIV